MSTRNDNWAETIFRFVALIVAYGLWCTVGLVLWIFLATRVSLAYGASLFLAAFSGQDPTISQDRLSAALHWWVDGMHRIRIANRPDGTANPSSRFSFWQECAFTLSAILIFCLCYFALPTSRAIYDSICRLLAEAPPRRDVPDMTATIIPLEATDTAEEPLPSLPAPQSSSLPPSPLIAPTLSSPLPPTPEQPIVKGADPSAVLPEPPPPSSVASNDREHTNKYLVPLPDPLENPYGELQALARPFVEENVDGVIYDHSPHGVSEREFRRQLIEDGVYSATLTSLPSTRIAAQKIKEELASRNIIVTIEELAENKPPYLANNASVLYYSDNNRELANVLAARFSKLSGIEFSATKGATPPLGPHLRFAIHCVPDSGVNTTPYLQTQN